MITRALDAGTPATWVADAEAYCGDPGLRTDLETRGMGYVLAVRKSHPVRTGAGKCRAGQLAAMLPPAGLAALLHWCWRSRPPLLRRAWVALTHGQTGYRRLLIRRHRALGSWPFTAVTRLRQPGMWQLLGPGPMTGTTRPQIG